MKRCSFVSVMAQRSSSAPCFLPASSRQGPRPVHSIATSQLPMMCWIVYAESPQQLQGNADGYRAEIPPAFWSELQQQGLLRADAPVP